MSSGVDALDGVFLGAVMQQDPFLEEFANPPEEPCEPPPLVRFPYDRCLAVFCGNQALANHYYKEWNHV